MTGSQSALAPLTTMSTATTWVWRVLCAISVYIAAFGIPGVQQFPPYHIDLDVYRIGGKVLLSSAELYGPMPATEAGINLPFTYPPLAAILFAPWTFLPMPVASVVMSLVTAGCLVFIIYAVLRHLGYSPALIWPVCTVLVAVGLWSGPVRETLGFGQINAVLTAIVLADVLLLARTQYRGLLIGVASAIKLTPLVFVLFYLARKDFRAMVQTGLAAVALTALAWVITPKDSTQYWFHTLTDTGRIGGHAYATNQSLNGILHRLNLEHTSMIWMALVVVSGLCVLWMMMALTDHPVAVVCINALWGLLVSPISWSHHWVWIIPVLLLIAHLRPSATRTLTVIVGVIVFYSTPFFALPHGDNQEILWPWWAHIVGACYVWMAVWCVGVLWRERASIPTAPNT